MIPNQLLDLDVLTKFEKHTPASVIPKIIIMFFGEIKTRYEKLVQAAEQDDMDNLEREAHAFKGSAGALGADKLRQIAIQLENAASQQNKDEINQLVASLPALIDDSIAALKVHFQHFELPDT